MFCPRESEHVIDETLEYGRYVPDRGGAESGLSYSYEIIGTSQIEFTKDFFRFQLF